MSIVTVSFRKGDVEVFVKRVDVGIRPLGDIRAVHELAAQQVMDDWEFGRKHHPDKAPEIDYDTVVVDGTVYPAAAGAATN